MRLTVAGIGIRGIKQLTLETLERVTSVKKIVYLPEAAPELEGLLREYTQAPIESLMHLYVSGSPDVENYQRILDRVVADCREYQDVLLLVPGHPRVGVTIVQWLEQQQPEHGINLDIFPGISSFATMNNDLKRDPLERGSVMLDANRLLLFDLHMESGFDYYIYHVCSIGTSRVHLTDATVDNRFDLLKRHLLKFFPADHEVQLVSSSVQAQGPADIRRCNLSELEQLLSQVHFGTTLFIPAARPRRVQKEFLKLLRDTAC